jgi:hypothetical protein
MIETNRGILSVLFALLLSGCFLAPGQFTSSLDIRKDGTFTFAYTGEIAVINPDGMMGREKPKVWSEKMGNCFKSGRTYLDEYIITDDDITKDGTVIERASDAAKDGVMDGSDTAPDPDSVARPCTPAELAKLKKEFDESQKSRAERQKRDSEQMAAVFGLSTNDDEAARKVAASLLKYQGWKAATYKGKGVYQVDYRITGRVGHDFVFPIFPQGDLMIPFISMRTRADGAVMVAAPGYSGGGFKGMANRMKMLGASSNDLKGMPETSTITKGTFTLTTDGTPVTNNTEDGPVAGTAGQTLKWDISNDSEKIPEALIRLR